jgi:hypothetical protein
MIIRKVRIRQNSTMNFMKSLLKFHQKNTSPVRGGFGRIVRGALIVTK